MHNHTGIESDREPRSEVYKSYTKYCADMGLSKAILGSHLGVYRDREFTLIKKRIYSDINWSEVKAVLEGLCSTY